MVGAAGPVSLFKTGVVVDLANPDFFLTLSHSHSRQAAAQHIFLVHKTTRKFEKYDRKHHVYEQIHNMSLIT